MKVLTPRQVTQVVAEFERLGVPPHGDGRIRTFASGDISGAEMLRRLRRLPNNAGIAAVNAALCADEGDTGADEGAAAT